MTRGGGKKVNLKFIALATALFFVGLYSVNLWSHNYQQSLLKTVSDQSLNVMQLLDQRLLQNTDSLQLMRAGYHLAQANNCQSAIPILKRSRELSPTNRDTNLALSWCLVQNPNQDQSLFKQTLHEAQITDSLNPFVREIASITKSQSSGK